MEDAYKWAVHKSGMPYFAIMSPICVANSIHSTSFISSVLLPQDFYECRKHCLAFNMAYAIFFVIKVALLLIVVSL